jgi:hypothetical protein
VRVLGLYHCQQRNLNALRVMGGHATHECLIAAAIQATPLQFVAVIPERGNHPHGYEPNHGSGAPYACKCALRRGAYPRRPEDSV